MYAQLEYNLCHGSEVMLVLYHSKKDADHPDEQRALLYLSLTNAQLSELVVIAKIKPVDADK